MGTTDFHGGAEKTQCIGRKDPLHSAVFLLLAPGAAVQLRQRDSHEVFTISSAPPAVGP